MDIQTFCGARRPVEMPRCPEIKEEVIFRIPPAPPQRETKMSVGRFLPEMIVVKIDQDEVVRPIRSLWQTHPDFPPRIKPGFWSRAALEFPFGKFNEAIFFAKKECIQTKAAFMPIQTVATEHFPMEFFRKGIRRIPRNFFVALRRIKSQKEAPVIVTVLKPGSGRERSYPRETTLFL